MNKRVNIFIGLALLFSLTQALYQNQVGVFDWNLKNIGDIDELTFSTHKVAFKSKDNVIGGVSIARGTQNYHFYLTNRHC